MEIKLGFASKNIGKFMELKSMLDDYSIELRLVDSYEEVTECDIGKDNAINKSLIGSKHSEIPVLASDECLKLDFLPAAGQPNAYIRRIVGSNASDGDIFNYYLDILARVEGQIGNGTITTHYAISFNGKLLSSLEITQQCVFTAPGSRVLLPSRPLASLHYFPKLDKYYSELTYNEKLYLNQDFAYKLATFINATSNNVVI